MNANRNGDKDRLTFRNAIDDGAHIPTQLLFSGRDQAEPLVSIVIPTYRRADLLIEAVRSALDQDLSASVEIIVVDDAPDHPALDQLLVAVPQLREANFRYWVHDRNMGQFRSHNRGLELARGTWVSILHDDDLLDPTCLSTLLRVAEQDPRVDGVIARKRTLTQSSVVKEYQPSRVHSLAKQAVLETQFLGRSSRPFPMRKFFWGPLLGNIAGFVFKRAAALEIGGFYPEQGPAADTWFLLRFATRFHLRQHRAIAATYRISDNLTFSPEVVKSNLQQGHFIKAAVLAGGAPQWWRHLETLIVARDLSDVKHGWNVDITREEAERLTGIKVGKDRPRLLWLIRSLIGGF